MEDFTTFDPSILGGTELYGLAPGDEGWNMQDASAAYLDGQAQGAAIDAAQAQQNNNDSMIATGIQTAAMMTPWGRVGSVVGNAVKPIAKSVFTPKPSPSVIGSTIQGGGRGTAAQTNYATQPYSGNLTNATQIGNKTSPYGQVQSGQVLNRDLGSAYNKGWVNSQVKGTGRIKPGPLGSQSKDAVTANLKKFKDAQKLKKLQEEFKVGKTYKKSDDLTQDFLNKYRSYNPYGQGGVGTAMVKYEPALSGKLITGTGTKMTPSGQVTNMAHPAASGRYAEQKVISKAYNNAVLNGKSHADAVKEAFKGSSEFRPGSQFTTDLSASLEKMAKSMGWFK